MSDTEQTRVMGVPGNQTMAADRTMVVPGGAAGATMQMPAAGAGNDPFRTQMGGTATCPICQSTTPLPEAYCGECGFLLSSTPVAEAATPVEETPVAELVDVSTGRRYRLKPGVNTLGRMGTDILVNEGTVSRAHARLTVEQGQVTVEDLGSSNGTKVGDRRIGANEPLAATHGTPLKFGNWRVMLEMAGGGTGFIGSAEQTRMVGAAEQTMIGTPPAAEPTMVGTPPVSTTGPIGASPAESAPKPAGPIVARLHCTKGPSGDIDLPEGTVTIGRKFGNTVVLALDTYVSGRHAEIVTDNTGSYLVDVGSTNGTVVNGQRMTPHEKQLLLEGDDIQLGQSRFTFEPMMPEDDDLVAVAAPGAEVPPVNPDEMMFTPDLGAALDHDQP